MARIRYIPNRVIDTNGISDGASIGVYQTGTLTPVSIYSDAEYTTPLSNPFTVNAGAPVPEIFADYNPSDLRVRVVSITSTVVSDDDPFDPSVNSADLSSPTGGALVGLTQGGKVQDAIKYITAAMGGIADDGDESADVTAALQAIADDAAALNMPIKLGPRTYRVSTTGVEFFTSVYGEAGTVIQSTASTDSAGPVVRMSGAGVIDTLTIDGNVSADPSPWSSGNYDSFTGAQGLIVGNVGSPVNGVTVKNVTVQNVRRAAFKVEIGSSGVSFDNCRAERCRSNFGDGYIVIGASRVTFKNCYATDFTRCGFVSDTYGDSPGTFSSQVSYENCWAEDGHDASILYGGIEYSAGFWAEKSGNISFLNCHVKNCYHRGFIMASGEAINGLDLAEFSADNCTVDGSETGFIVQGLSSIPAYSRMTNCAYLGDGLTAFSFTGGTTGDSIHIRNCAATLSGTQVSRSSVKASPGSLVIDGFTETWDVLNTTYRDAADNYYGSVSHFADTVGKVVINDWKTYDSGGSVIPSVFKFLPATAATLSLHVARCYMRGVYINAVKMTTVDVDWDRLGSLECTSVHILRGTNYETSTPFSSPIFNTSKGFVFDGVVFDFDTSGGAMHFRNSDSVATYSKLTFRGCTFIKDFETDNYAVLLDMSGGSSGTIAGTTDANHIYATDIVAINTGGSTTNPVFFIDSNTDAAGKLNGNGKKASSITNMVQSGKLAASASYTAWGS